MYNLAHAVYTFSIKVDFENNNFKVLVALVPVVGTNTGKSQQKLLNIYFLSLLRIMAIIY